jgi:hypothetical protein
MAVATTVATGPPWINCTLHHCIGYRRYELFMANKSPKGQGSTSIATLRNEEVCKHVMYTHVLYPYTRKNVDVKMQGCVYQSLEKRRRKNGPCMLSSVTKSLCVKEPQGTAVMSVSQWLARSKVASVAQLKS